MLAANLVHLDGGGGPRDTRLVVVVLVESGQQVLTTVELVAVDDDLPQRVRPRDL